MRKKRAIQMDFDQFIDTWNGKNTMASNLNTERMHEEREDCGQNASMNR